MHSWSESRQMGWDGVGVRFLELMAPDETVAVFWSGLFISSPSWLLRLLRDYRFVAIALSFALRAFYHTPLTPLSVGSLGFWCLVAEACGRRSWVLARLCCTESLGTSLSDRSTPRHVAAQRYYTTSQAGASMGSVSV